MDVNTTAQDLLNATRNEVTQANYGAALIHLTLLMEQLVENIRVLRIGE